MQGDCAELFDYCNMDMIEAKVKLLLQMSLVLIWGMSSYYRIMNYANITQEQTSLSSVSPELQANSPSKSSLST